MDGRDLEFEVFATVPRMLVCGEQTGSLEPGSLNDESDGNGEIPRIKAYMIQTFT